jgi:phosphoribosylformimino-5-aminoimidazole carboxamide ribotide isomerase
MREWAVYPAIDLRKGRVVRLAQGDPERETWYSDDPASVARRWRDAGAEWVHVINLDGALDEAGAQNAAALREIVHVGLKVQFGGGMRDLPAMRTVAELGVRRVIIGTAAVEDPALVQAALAELGAERVAVGIDAREGTVRTHGWRREEGVAASELALWWKQHGAQWIIYTEIGRAHV